MAAKVINIRLTPNEHAKLSLLGGSVWVRDVIANPGKPVRHRAGRPPHSEKEFVRSERFQVKVSVQEASTFLKMGGSAWIRKALSYQPVPLNHEN